MRQRKEEGGRREEGGGRREEGGGRKGYIVCAILCHKSQCANVQMYKCANLLNNFIGGGNKV